MTFIFDNGIQPGSSGGVNTDLTNVSSTGTSLGAGWSMPSSKYVNLTLGASGASYIAPANGYYYMKLSGASAQASFIFSRSDSNSYIYGESCGSGANYFNPQGMFPVSKNDIITIDYMTDATMEYFRFIYAVGSESEV